MLLLAGLIHLLTVVYTAVIALAILIYFVSGIRPAFKLGIWSTVVFVVCAAGLHVAGHLLGSILHFVHLA